MNPHIIVLVHVTDRIRKAGEVQKIFTEFGCNIKTRIGLHEVSEKVCRPSGVIVLEIFGREKDADKLVRRLRSVKGVEAKKVVFGH
ncbi:MAG: hypothetical protein ACOY3K_04575 [Candidatus Omnitrophota bacterium]